MQAIPRLRQALFAAILFSTSALFAEDVYSEQTWTSDDGREIVARVLELDIAAGSVKMRRSDGFIFTLDFDRLSASDVARLREAGTRNEPEDSRQTPEPETTKIPDRLELDDVPMVRQKGNYCVPASAAMIAGYHGIDTDQDQIAFLSSEGSFNNQGTYPQDMLLAMEKLGFDGRAIYWIQPEEFKETVLPAIRKALFQMGPVYISFRAGVFGESGHGCIIIGYHDRKEELIFHNPWGNVFEKTYEDVAKQAQGIVIIEAPQPAPIASEAFIGKVKEIVPKFEGDLSYLIRRLQMQRLEHELIWCSRADARDDRRFAVDTARDDGRKILDLAFHRNPAVFIPRNDKDGTTESYLFVTRPPEGGAQFLIREIGEDGWSEPELVTLGSLTRHWPTRIDVGTPERIIWELPMIELHPGD